MSTLLNRTLMQHAESLAKKEYSSAELTDAYLKRIEEIDSRLDAYLCVCSETARRQAEVVDRRRLGGEKLSPLAGIPMAVKDNLCTRGIPTTCGSRMLESYRPPYDATVVRRLQEAGAILLGKTNMDEFAMGSDTEHSAYQITKNPHDLTRVAGGSSGGSAAAVAADEAPWALGSDTGGSVRQPSAFCGTVGMRPTYGAVSRYGLVAYASSLDTVAPITRTVRENAIVLEAMFGKDPQDATSVAHPSPRVRPNSEFRIDGMKIGVCPQALEAVQDPRIRLSLEKAAERFRSLGAEICPVTLPSLSLSVAAYCVIASAEASSNLARFDGIRYGKRAANYQNTDDLYCRSRSEGFGDEVKRRILFGTYVLGKGSYESLYQKAVSVRTAVRTELQTTLHTCDCLLFPVTPTLPYRIGEKTEQPATRFSEDLFCLPASLAGYPALSMPCDTADGLPVAMQLIGRPFEEALLYNLGELFEHSARKEAPHA